MKISPTGKWNSSPHPISDIRDWRSVGRLEVQPDYQRRAVWSQAARVMLIDTILRGIPMPKIFVWNEIVNGSTHRRVIDGQQRVTAILDFLDGKFQLSAPYTGPYEGLTFDQLPKDVTDLFLQYQIDFNEALGFSDAEVREVYSRVNKYSMPLNRQELRQADYPGEFLKLASYLASDDYLDESRVFTVANRRRMNDVEYISEVLAGTLEGPQDKKNDLDYFYYRYKNWPQVEVDKVRDGFLAVLSDFRLIFIEPEFPLRSTRFRQKSDFYSLFLSVHSLKALGYGLDGKDLSPLRLDLGILNDNIAPESDIDVLSEYAIKCVSQANSASSRSWRKEFLTQILSGTYCARKPTGTALNRLSTLRAQLNDEGNGELFAQCLGCDKDLGRSSSVDKVLEWPTGTPVFQMSNAGWRCASCDPIPSR